ncbi:TniQ family protein [Streptomyces sp. NPDC006654]|uniref:TniQ family protein n=1 Tax=Streptomyces sp. NPDC006654 TaxID=3156897 RepID=UPI0033D5ED82
MSTGARTLPIRYAPIASEALDSWLEFLAARLHCHFADVLRSLGLPMRDVGLSNPMLPRWTVLATADEIASIAASSGVAEDVLEAMTLRRFDGHAVAIRADQRRVERRVLWGRAGSRYCPGCLDESDGRWQLSWRLGWSFACTRHQVLLADRCPACHRIPRVRAHPRRETPRPGRCAGPQLDGPRGARCHHPLSDTPVVALESDGSMVRTQRLIDDLLAAPEQTVHWPLYGTGSASLLVVLRDVRCLGGLILNHAAVSDLTEAAEPAVLRQMEVYRSRPAATGARHSRLDVHSYYAPDDAAATAVALAAALQVLADPSVPAAGEAARWLTERITASGRPLHPGGMALLSGGTISAGLQAALRRSRETKVMPVARLRHRTAIASTRPPDNQDTRARMLPTALWPEWALRLAPWHASGKPVARRTEELLATACLLVGNTTKIHTAVRLMGTTVSSHNVSSLLAELTRRPDCADVLHALVLLADHLDQHGSPIDYARRRALFTPRAHFIDPEPWYDLQRRTRANHLPDITHAHRWIFHTLTGTPPRLAHPTIAPTTPSQSGQYLRFRWRILPAEAELLTQTARTILDEHGIDEPVQWAPRLAPAVLRPLTLPGPDPESITVDRLHEAVPVGDFSIAQVARRLNTTTAHVIYLLSRHPVDWSPPRFRRTQHTATRIGQWRHWYEHDHLSLQDIADREGTSLASVRLAFLKNDVPIRPPGTFARRRRQE